MNQSLFIFVVHYRESERNTFQVFVPTNMTVAHDYVETPLTGHACGYLITRNDAGVWSYGGVPKLQRRKFCGTDNDEDFLCKLTAEAITLTSEDVARMQEERRDYITKVRRQEKEHMSKTADGEGDKKVAKAKKEKTEATGEKKVRAERFSPDGKLKIKKLVDKNPREEGSKGYRNFDLIRSGMSIDKYREAGGSLSYLKTEVEKKRVELVE